MNHTVSLTIGMIVKNEKDHLEACLRSLQPLRDALSCQLIITDTGSTDGTQEIASQYADDYLEFAWCDDFSKARNTGVEQAKGRWFLYVDADHVFDDSLLALIPFLNTPSVDDLYDSASVTIVNYTGSREQITGSFTQQRPLLVNFSKGKRYFQHRIHESIPVHPHATYTLPTTIIHWGYLDQGRGEKSQRNRRLLQEQMKEDPHNLKHHLQLLKDVDTWQEKKELLLTALSLGESDPNSATDPRLWLLYTHLLKLALEQKDWTLFQETQARRPEGFTHSVIHCDYLGLCLHASLLRGDSAETLSLFTLFRPLFFKFQEKPDSEYGMLDSYTYAQERFYYQIEPDVLKLLSSHTAPQTQEILHGILAQSKGISYSIQYENKALFTSYAQVLWALERYDLMAEQYGLIRSSQCISEVFYQFVQKKSWNTRVFSAFASQEVDYFTSLCKAWVDGVNGLSHGQRNALATQADLYTNPLSALLFYPLLKEQQDPLALLTHCTPSQIASHSQRLWKQAPEFLPLVVQSLGEGGSQCSLAYEKFTAGLGTSLLTHLLTLGKQPQAETLFPVVQEKMVQYVHKVYQNWVYIEETRDVLSPSERLSLAYEGYKEQGTEEAQEKFVDCLKAFPLFSVFHPKNRASTSAQNQVLEGERQTSSHSAPDLKSLPSLSSLSQEWKEKMLTLLQEGRKEEAFALLQSYQTQPSEDQN